MHVSLDGFVAGPNGEMDWISYTPELEKYVHDMTDSLDASIFGRKTYRMMEGYWPTVPGNPDSTPAERRYANWVNAATKYVVSNNLYEVTWENTVVVGGDLAAEFGRIKQEPGKDIMMIGSPETVYSFTRLGLIDEYRLNVNPIVLGAGIPLFADLDSRVHLDLLESQIMPGGVVASRYAVAGR
jgi:dihydrofolate reductase